MGLMVEVLLIVVVVKVVVMDALGLVVVKAD